MFEPGKNKKGWKYSNSKCECSSTGSKNSGRLPTSGRLQSIDYSTTFEFNVTWSSSPYSQMKNLLFARHYVHKILRLS